MRETVTGILIQARTGSTRLPGKIFSGLPVDGDPSLLERIYARLLQVEGADQVAFVIPDDDTVLRSFLQKLSIPFVEGDGLDVRKRYRFASAYFGLDLIVRATGDNPCVDPVVAADTIAGIQREKCDLFSFSNLPLGIAVEAFTSEALFSEHAGNRPEHREHVSLHIKHSPSFFRVCHREHPLMKSFRGLELPRLTVDTAEDLEVVRNVYKELGLDFNTSDILKLYQKKPELFQSNKHVEQITFPAVS